MLKYGSFKVIDNVIIIENNRFEIAILPGAYGSTISPTGAVDHKSPVAFTLLRIYSKVNRAKNVSCLFKTIEQSIYFVNEYLSKCKSIKEVEIEYNSFRVGQDSINEKGYM